MKTPATEPRQDQKVDLITFKVDPALSKALNGIRNRSEFIRTAVLAALAGTCPLCRGTGVLTPQQRRHWDRFASNHVVETCNRCHASHLVCGAHSEGQPAPRRTRKAQP